MSIPLDRLYHYIESVAQEVHGDVIIYRFWPHGSKKIEDLTMLDSKYTTKYSWKTTHTAPIIHCNDQEPLDFSLYQNIERSKTIFSKPGDEAPAFKNCNLPNIPDYNLTMHIFTVNDKSIILHSEQRSHNVDLYNNSCFVPVYYWSHALISLDWFRYAQHEKFKKTNSPTRFLIYNRAWSNTREYRLKFLDSLIDSQLISFCQTSFQPREPELNTYYQDHVFKNSQWQPNNRLEDYFDINTVASYYSADFVTSDYNSTDIEVVLETLFDDNRLHLTEKSLRPIACKQPFILAATHGSLAYLRSYGFKTFDGIIDESYDLIQDPVERMGAIVSAMKKITLWSDDQYKDNMKKLQEIAEYNQQHFFSEDFFDLIVKELKHNLACGIDTVKNTATGQRFIEIRKILSQHHPAKVCMTTDNYARSRRDITDILKIARQYQIKNP